MNLVAIILPLSCDEPTLEASMQLARGAGLVACAPRTNRPRDRRIGWFPAGRIPTAWCRLFARQKHPHRSQA